MGALEIIIIIAAAALVVFTVVFNIVRRQKNKKNKGKCGGGCLGCSYSGMCSAPKTQQDSDEKEPEQDVEKSE